MSSIIRSRQYAFDGTLVMRLSNMTWGIRLEGSSVQTPYYLYWGEEAGSSSWTPHGSYGETLTKVGGGTPRLDDTCPLMDANSLGFVGRTTGYKSTGSASYGDIQPGEYFIIEMFASMDDNDALDYNHYINKQDPLDNYRGLNLLARPSGSTAILQFACSGPTFSYIVQGTNFTRGAWSLFHIVGAGGLKCRMYYNRGFVSESAGTVASYVSAENLGIGCYASTGGGGVNANLGYLCMWKGPNILSSVDLLAFHKERFDMLTGLGEWGHDFTFTRSSPAWIEKRENDGTIFYYQLDKGFPRACKVRTEAPQSKDIIGLKTEYVVDYMASNKSEDFSSYYNPYGSISANVSGHPSIIHRQNMTGFISASGASGTAKVMGTTGFSATAGTYYLMIGVFEKGSTDWLRLNFWQPTAGAFATSYFDLANGVKGATQDAAYSGILSVGGNKFLIWISDAAQYSENFTCNAYPATGNGATFTEGDGSTIQYYTHAWNQYAAVCPRSYMRVATTGSPITREADKIRYSNIALPSSLLIRFGIYYPDWANYDDYTYGGSPNYPRPFALSKDNGTSNLLWLLTDRTNGKIYTHIKANGGTDYSLNSRGSIFDGLEHDFRIYLKDNVFLVKQDNELVGKRNDITMPELNTIHPGQAPSADAPQCEGLLTYLKIDDV